MDVFVDGSYAYVADRSNGFEIFDITDPTNPIEVDSYSHGDWTNGVFVSGSYLYVANDDGGLEIFTWITNPSVPLNVKIIDNHNRTITITWDAPIDDGGSEIIRYEIYRGTSPDDLDKRIWVVDKLYYYTSYAETGVEYFYNVTAINSVG